MHNIPNSIAWKPDLGTKKRGVEVEDTVAKRQKFDRGEDQIRLIIHSLMTTEFGSRT